MDNFTCRDIFPEDGKLPETVGGYVLVTTRCRGVVFSLQPVVKDLLLSAMGVIKLS